MMGLTIPQSIQVLCQTVYAIHFSLTVLPIAMDARTTNTATPLSGNYREIHAIGQCIQKIWTLKKSFELVSPQND
jgi:hypothetical protein